MVDSLVKLASRGQVPRDQAESRIRGLAQLLTTDSNPDLARKGRVLPDSIVMQTIGDLLLQKRGKL